MFIAHRYIDICWYARYTQIQQNDSRPPLVCQHFFKKISAGKTWCCLAKLCGSLGQIKLEIIAPGIIIKLNPRVFGVI
jgi:hypothetical protein